MAATADSVNQAAVDNRLTQSQSPQNSGGQSLAAPAASLQTTVPLQSGGTKATITSVGDSTFKPFTADATATTTEEAAPLPPNNKRTQVLITGAVLTVLCIVVTWWMTSRSQAKLAGKRK